jgi:hypothetical protein
VNFSAERIPLRYSQLQIKASDEAALSTSTQDAKFPAKQPQQLALLFICYLNNAELFT